MQQTNAFLNSTSPLDASFEIHHVPSIHHFLILSPKPVKPTTNGFEAQTTKPSMPSFESQTSKPSSNGFETQTIKLSIPI
jgi:hypothetical protein